MNDVRLGTGLRAIRLRRRLTQKQLASAARVSRQQISLVERGHLEQVNLFKLRSIAAALGASLDMVLRWRGGDLDRLLSRGHAAMHERMAAMFVQLEGWEFAQEVAYSIYGERGVIDILAWHPGRGILLVIELKTEVVDINDLLAQMDRRRRLAVQIAQERGWGPGAVATWVVLADTRTNRRRLAAHAAMLRHAFPLDGRAIRRWLRVPTGAIGALSFLPDATVGGERPHAAAGRRVTRVRRPKATHEDAQVALERPRVGVTFGG